MSARPRPVTATVTKPPWMQVPDADAALYRCQSLTSNGSTASLTSVLDHDSYVSEPEYEAEKSQEACNQPVPNSMGDAQSKVHFDEQPRESRKIKRHTVESADNLRRSTSTDSGLSPWEMWLIQKAKEERKLQKQARQQKKQEKEARLAKEREKQQKEEKAAEVRQEWLEKKSTEEKMRKKVEKLKIKHEKQVKQEEEERIHRKAEEIFKEWKEAKQREEKERRQREKEKEQKEQEAKEARKEQAEQRYQDWLKRNKKRPQSAPSKQVTGYNNNAAYPKPGYVNPIPWQHPAIPKVKQEKPKKSRPRKYVWNPDKYF
ncbi:uncharacterized protein LOC143297909 [Babylonia areolata]|uniref:uncharacterized protein LOC143297909 n=1 Tax=Babylonia areolata TaxID=304850 RepID=UPI003FCF907A